MTSKISLNKLMLTDIRQRLWMPILSLAVEFLLGPVVMIFNISQHKTLNQLMESKYYSLSEAKNYVLDTVLSFSNTAQFMYVTIATIGAILLALCGFRHLCSKRMMDVYGAVPTTRTREFLVIYLNGIIIFAIPFIICFGISTGLALGYLGDAALIAKALPTFFQSFGITFLTFFAVYHLFILAVTLCGHAFISLVTAVLIGLDVYMAVVSVRMLCYYFFDTYYGLTLNSVFFAGLSPLMCPLTILEVSYNGYFYSSSESSISTLFIIITVAVAVLNLCLSIVFYKKRPAELAEGGLGNKHIRRVLVTYNSILAGILGAILMISISSEGSTIWGVFGAVVLPFAAYGVLNIILNRSGKAFFKDFGGIIASIAISILIIVTFNVDIFNYDYYLPSKDKIASMGIDIGGSGDYGSRLLFEEDGNCIGYDYNSIMDDSVITDRDLIYDLLCDAVENQRLIDVLSEDEDGYIHEGDASPYQYYLTVNVKLTNGRTYYRQYNLSTESADLVTKIENTEEYIEAYYPISRGTYPYPNTNTIWKNKLDTYDYGDGTVGTYYYSISSLSISKEDFNKLLDIYYHDFKTYGPKSHEDYYPYELQLSYSNSNISNIRYSYDYYTNIMIPEAYKNTIEFLDNLDFIMEGENVDYVKA